MFFDFNKGFNGDKLADYDNRSPIIAISSNIIDENSALHFAYSQAILDCGATPIIIPANINKNSLISIIDKVDGLLFSGGSDIDASYFGEENLEALTEVVPERDYYEFMLLRAALDRGIPILGICRGVQLINIALGGSIYQDLPSQHPTKALQHSINTNKHVGVHHVTIEKNSLLYKIVKTESLNVNSRHHQALKDVAPTLKVTARSSDNVIEAVEGYPELKIMGVQWHPENMATTGDNCYMKKIFRHLTDEALLFKKAREIHQHSPSIDSHCDTPMLFRSEDIDLSIRNQSAKVDFIKMLEGGVDATITVAYIPQTTPKESCFEEAQYLLSRLCKEVSNQGGRAAIAKTREDILSNKIKGIKSVILAIENGAALAGDIANLDYFHSLGVRYITLCHNGQNEICDSCTGERMFKGISSFGERVIKRMNELNILIDISHSSEEASFAALELSKSPIIASHSSCKALCDHRRNLSDELIKAIAQKGGVIQVCGYGGFLKRDNDASIIDLIDHIEHVIKIAGCDSVGVGSDFDGDGGVLGFEGSNHFKNITIELLRRGYSEVEISKIIGGNILRVL